MSPKSPSSKNILQEAGSPKYCRPHSSIADISKSNKKIKIVDDQPQSKQGQTKYYGQTLDKSKDEH